MGYIITGDLKLSCMRGVNRVMLIGNLGKDPDVQYLEGNIAVAKFPLATTETYKDRAGKLISQTEWHTVVLWRGLAELAQKYLHKGSLIYVEGRLRTRSWDDREGNKKFATEIVGDNLIMLDKRNDGSGGGYHAAPGATDAAESFPGTDIPPLSDEPIEGLPF
ncbi:single-stranded DNA-binding protein [soil metagenome]